MKNSYYLLTLILTLILFSGLHAQFTQTSGPGGGPISSFATNGSALYVGTGYTSGSGYGGGMYASTNNGVSWNSLPYNPTSRDDRNISAIGVSGSTIIAGTIKGIVFTSTDAGATWTRTPLSSNKAVTIIITDGTNFYLGSDGGGVFTTTIGSTTWTTVNTGISSKRITGIVKDGSTMYASTAFGGAPLYKSTDSGSSWALDTLPPSAFNAFSVALISGKLYVGAQNGVYTSTNNGASWVGPVSGLTNSTYGFALVGSTVFTGTSSGIYSIPIAGSAWTTVTSSYGVTALLSTGSGLFAGLMSQSGLVSNGVQYTTNSGTTWLPRSEGICATTIHSMLVNGSSLYALTKGQGLYVSTDGGTTWSLSAASAVGYDAQSQNLGIHNGKLFASTSTGLLTSTDNGTVWVPSSPGFSAQAFYSFGSKVFVGENGGIRVSTDNGLTWTQNNSGLSGYLSTNCFGSKGDKVFAGLYSSGFYVSSDSGSTWLAQTTGLGSQRIRSIAVMGSKIFAATDDHGIYVSTDDGASWTAKSSGLSSQNIWSLAVNGHGIFAATNNGISVSSDSGETWTSTTPSTFIANVVTIQGTDIYCGTLSVGVWKVPVSSLITSVNEIPGNGIPTEFSLSANYPNPFNPTTNFGFQIADLEFVTLKIYDVLGREIQTLVNEKLHPGNYTVKWNAGNMTSGIYFYKLTAGNNTQTRKMLLTK